MKPKDIFSETIIQWKRRLAYAVPVTRAEGDVAEVVARAVLAATRHSRHEALRIELERVLEVVLVVVHHVGVYQDVGAGWDRVAACGTRAVSHGTRSPSPQNECAKCTHWAA